MKRRSHVLKSTGNIIKVSSLGESMIKSCLFSDQKNPKEISSQQQDQKIPHFKRSSVQSLKHNNLSTEIHKDSLTLKNHERSYRNWINKKSRIQKYVNRKITLNQSKNSASYDWKQQIEQCKQSIDEIFVHIENKNKQEKLRKIKRITEITHKNQENQSFYRLRRYLNPTSSSKNKAISQFMGKQNLEKIAPGKES